MRYLSHTKRHFSDGFTLIEILIIAPIVILVVSGFVALMINMIGDSLVTGTQNTLTYNTQDALDRIEQDTRLTTQFLATSDTLPSPQGSNNNFAGTAAFSSSNSLILGGLTTDQNPANINRQLIYYANQPNNCGSLQTYNRVFQGKIIYFINNGTLWRRTTIPAYDLNSTVDANTVCSAPWQRNTCSPGYTTGTVCQTNDTDVMDNVASFSVKYLSSAASTVDLGSANALSANAIQVTITGTQTSLGKNITSSGTILTTKLNSVPVDLPLPATPVVTSQIVNNTVNFSWSLVPNATSYSISYNINGGAWTNASVDNRTSSYSVNAGGGDTVTIQVTASNSTGNSGTATALGTIPRWYTCGLQNGWSDYGGSFTTNGYTKTRDSTVLLKGVIKGGTATSGTTLCTLPVGYRPTARLIFMTTTSGGAEGVPSRVDVLPDGEVQIIGGNNGWVSLDGINFVDAGAGYSWYAPTLLNGWVNYGSTYSNLQLASDATGRTHIQGLIKSGTTTDWTPTSSFPTSYEPSQTSTWPATSNLSYTAFGITNSATTIARGYTGGNGYYSLQAMFYPSSFSSWNSLTLQNGWVAFDPVNYSPPQYTKSSDGVVTVRGMIKNGTTTDGTVIATLPAGDRPSATVVIPVDSVGSFGRVDILTNGNIVVRIGYSGWITLDPVSFIGEQ
jgi:hypothetical protein